jgi:uncharacterized protein (DUF433 family)
LGCINGLDNLWHRRQAYCGRTLTIGSSDRECRLRWAKEGVDDRNKVPSFDADEAPRRSASSLDPFFWTRSAHWSIVSAMSSSVVTASPDVMSGAPVFPGTRVPVQTLLEYLEAGDSIDDFLAGFPSVSRSQVIAFLERATILAVTDAA